ncbi:glutaredoxin-C9-like protein [Tanacetum coccineum]|uniref:Glutaredoxin-C9-like protein n=1 Tax=Tanacetum coccineum TaxID=301880 RepID=A0ABQ5G313_9ASTR
MQTSGVSKDTLLVTKLVTENAVMVFGQRGFCMCHVVRHLLLGLGVNPTISVVDEGDMAELRRMFGEEMVELPVVYIGGKLFGGMERLIVMTYSMNTKITGLSS